MATHSSVLAWRIPGTGERGGLPSMGSHRIGHDWSDLAAAAKGKRVRGVELEKKDEYYTLLLRISVLIPQMNKHFQHYCNIFSSIYKMYTWNYTLIICQILPIFKLPEIQNCQILVDNKWQKQLPEVEESQSLLNFSQRELVYLLLFKRGLHRRKEGLKPSIFHLANVPNTNLKQNFYHFMSFLIDYKLFSSF